MIKPPCKSYVASRDRADKHTRDVFALIDMILVQDFIDGKIDRKEFLLCAVVDEAVNK